MLSHNRPKLLKQSRDVVESWLYGLNGRSTVNSLWINLLLFEMGFILSWTAISLTLVIAIGMLRCSCWFYIHSRSDIPPIHTTTGWFSFKRLIFVFRNSKLYFIRWTTCGCCAWHVWDRILFMETGSTCHESLLLSLLLLYCFLSFL